MKKISTKVKPLQTGGDGTAYYGEEVIKEKALSKKQQRFFGIVRAIQKGEQEPTTPETAKAAADMKKSDVKKYASTKHAKLPEKKIDEDNNFYNSAVDFSKIKNMPIKKPIKDFPKRDAEGNVILPKPRPLKGGIKPKIRDGDADALLKGRIKPKIRIGDEDAFLKGRIKPGIKDKGGNLIRGKMSNKPLINNQVGAANLKGGEIKEDVPFNSAIDFSKIDRSKIRKGPYRPKRDAEGNIIPPKFIKGPYKGPNPLIPGKPHPGMTPLSKGGEI